MKTFGKFLIACVVALAATLPASAQFRFGLKAGGEINKLKFNKEALASDNRGGFTGGIMIDFTAPVIGVGMDASVLYSMRSAEFGATDEHQNRSYIDIPINFKWKLSLPAVGKIVAPFVTTGPDFSFLCSKKNFENAWHNRKFDFAWNVGLGVEFFRHLQVAASYGIGITNSASGAESLNGTLFHGKNRSWTVTAAYLF